MRILILIFDFQGLSKDVYEDAHQLKVTSCLHSWAVVLTGGRLPYETDGDARRLA